MTRMHRRRRRAIPSSATRGFGLVELLVALALGSSILVGAVAAFTRARNVQRAQDALARMHETAVYALSVLETDLRMAGYWGLAGSADVVVPHASFAFPERCGGASWVTQVQLPVTGTNNAYPSLANCAAASGGAQPGADVLVSRRASAELILPLGPTVPAQHQDRVLAISRLGSAELFVPEQLSGAVPGGYPPGSAEAAPLAELRRVLVHAYYVSRGSSVGAGVPALRRKVLRAGPTVADEEIVVGVEDLQFRIGADVDGDGSVDADFEPGTVPAGAIPRFVRLWLRVVSTERDRPRGGTPAVAYADRAWASVDDGFSRFMVSKTIQLRNGGS